MKTGPTSASRMATLPRIQPPSAVTLTLSEGAKTTYAEIIATARRSIPLTEIGVKSIGMRKAVTGVIIIKVPGEKRWEKATGDAPNECASPDRGQSGISYKDGGAEDSWDRHLDREGGTATSVGPGGRVRSCVNTSGGDRSLQKRPRGGVCKVPGGRSPQIGPGRESSLGMVHCGSHRDPKEVAPMLQMPRARTRTSHMRVHCGTRAPVLQVRRKRTPCKRMSRLRMQMPPVRIARSTRQP
jgi:hypothetical protein